MPRTCGFMELHQYAVANEFGYADVRRSLEAASAFARRAPLPGVTKIPVVVHVVYHDESQNISDQAVHEQIRVLNEDFRAANPDISRVPAPFQDLVADARIEFELARRNPMGFPTTGITRKQTSIATFPHHTPPPGASSTPYIDTELKTAGAGVVAWPREQYLNIWVCDMNRGPLGYAAFPGSAAWRDGVVIDFTCFGVGGKAVAPFDRGRTAVHEVGHWLNLLHIWGDDHHACTHSDDCGDTPNQGGPNYDEPTFPSISCNNGPHGDLFVNFMDYVNDAAMVMFTAGQVGRMHATLQGARASLLTSHALGEPERTAPVTGLDGLRTAAETRGGPVEEVFDGVGWVPAGG